MGKKRTVQSADLFGERLAVEQEMLASGMASICGVDEAGRGPLAGPVVAAAVIYRDCDLLRAARDSKVMTPAAREEFVAQVAGQLEFSVGMCGPLEIDEINILQASLRAMERAVAALTTSPSIILVDGNQRLAIATPSRAIVHGDARVAVISAASIIAKVTRDRLMSEYDLQYPGYGFARHFGYPTEEHRRCLKELGPSPIHRRTFHGVREHFQETADPS